MLPRTNTIFIDDGYSATNKINNIINQSQCIIVVAEESSKYKYEGLEDMTENKIYDIGKSQLLADKIKLPLRKFSALVRQGIIKRNATDVVIFRLQKCNKELVNIFKVFYMRNLMIETKRPLILTYLQIIAPGDIISLHSYLCKNPQVKLEERRIINVFVTPQRAAMAEEYIFYKNVLLSELQCSKEDKLRMFYNKILEAETVTFKYGLYLLRQHFKFDSIETTTIDESNNQLLINDFKYRKLLHIIGNFSDSIIYIQTSNPYLMDYITAQVDSVDKIRVYNKKADVSKNSVLILYEGGIYNDNREFYKIFVFHGYHKKEHIDQNIIVNQIETMNLKEQNIDFYDFLEYRDEGVEGLALPGSDAFVDFEYAYVTLQMIISLICALFKENCLVQNENVIKSMYKEKNGHFCCTIILPQFHDDFDEINGLYFQDKKSAQKDTALKAIDFLYHIHVIDENLCPIIDKLIYKNKQYYYRSCRYYKLKPVKGYENDSITYNFVEATEENFTIPNEFLAYVTKKGLMNDKLKEKVYEINQKTQVYKKHTPYCIVEPSKTKEIQFMKDSDELNDISTIIKTILPECLKKYDSLFYCYSFEESESSQNESQLGICTGASFKEKLTYQNIQISFLRTITFTETQMQAIVFLQVLIFAIYFKKIKEHKMDAFEYSYLIIPLKNGNIDFELLLSLEPSEFLTGDVYNNIHNEALLKSNFLYNPFINKFYCYGEPCSRSLNDQEMLGDSVKSYKEYFEEKYNTRLLKTEGNNLLFLGYNFDKRQSTIPCILSTEIMQITSIKKDFGTDFEKMKKRIFAFERAALAFQFKQQNNINFSTQLVIQCFSAAEENYPNYECLEFLGDCLLKFVSIKYLFLTMVCDINSYIKAKDYLISNDSLFETAKKLEITKYFSFIKYCDSLFQPPSLFKLTTNFEPDFRDTCKEIIDYFNTGKLFMSSNATLHCDKFQYHGDKVKGAKVYADIVEALMGACFITNGFARCEEFIYQIGVINKVNTQPNFISTLAENKVIHKIPEFKTIDSNFPKVHADISLMKEYRNILPMSDVKSIESILNYKFKNPGLIEKVMIHPSSHNNVLGSIHFNKLELLGDAIIDMVVTIKIYREEKYNNPELLHSKRKSLVNNFSLARVLFKTNLINHLHSCFDTNYFTRLYDKLKLDGGSVNKAFGDVFESICGAIIVDMDLNIYEFQEYFLKNMYHFLEACADTTR